LRNVENTTAWMVAASAATYEGPDTIDAYVAIVRRLKRHPGINIDLKSELESEIFSQTNYRIRDILRPDPLEVEGEEDLND
jgi:hypothetical protein